MAWHPTLLAMQLQALFPGSQTRLQLSAELCTQCSASNPPSPTLHRFGLHQGLRAAEQCPDPGFACLRPAAMIPCFAPRNSTAQ